MEPIAFCKRCRGMRVGWNMTYIQHCLICKEMISRSAKLLIFTVILSSLIFAFPITTEIVLSELNSGPRVGSQLPVVEASLVPVPDPAIRMIDHLLSLYGVEDQQRSRVSHAVVQSAKKFNVDPKLLASIIIVESRANPFAISESSSVGIMQIHLPTWGPAADRENINLFKIEDNVDLGARILKGYISQYGLWDGVMRYKGWTDSPESHVQADEYVQKVKSIYQPAPAQPAETALR